MSYKTTLSQRYEESVIPSLNEAYGYRNIMEVPKLEKISVNQGVGAAVADKKLIERAVTELTSITGQKAVPTYAKRAVSSFKLREGMPIGAKVTLRRSRMFEFLQRLISISLPRVRDFRGVSDKGFDGHGNFTMGVSEQIIFPEVIMDNVERLNGLDITFVTTAQTDQEAYTLLKELGIPFKDANKE